MSLATALFGEAIPFLEFYERILERPAELIILEDNQATIKVLRKGRLFSQVATREPDPQGQPWLGRRGPRGRGDHRGLLSQ